MAVSDRLAILITADGRGAVREFQKVGAAADRNLGRAEAGALRFGDALTKVGVGAIAFSAVAGVGLFKAAQASEEAHLSVVKLENTLANMPLLASENAKSFIDLADAIQAKTAADGDAIVEAQAMLGTFRLTGKEIRGLTPLVVDYARKFGVDMTSASVQVGKAIDGQIGALKRNGVSIDENLFKTDRYAAVTRALRDQVGGFAEREGQTFAGQLERTKNILGDVQEGIGVGVVGALNDVLGPLSSVASKFKELNPETQEAAGRIATIGTAAIGAVGALSFMSGQAVKMSARFTEAGVGLTRFGKAAKFVGVVGAIGLVVTAIDLLRRSTQGLTVDIGELSRSTDEELVGAFQEIQNAPFGTPAFGKAMDFFRETAEESIGVATRLRDALAAQGVEVSALDKVLQEETARQRQSARDMRNSTDAVDENTDAIDENALSTDKATKKTGALSDAVRSLSSAMSGVQDSQEGYQDALESIDDASASVADAQLSLNDAFADQATILRDAARDVESAQRSLHSAQRGVLSANRDLTEAKEDQTAAQRDYDQAVADFGPNSKKAHDALEALEEANWNASEAQFSAEESQLRLRDATEELGDSTKRLSDEQRGVGEGARQVREAQDRLAEAQENLKETQDGLLDATLDLEGAIRDQKSAFQEAGAQGVRDYIAWLDLLIAKYPQVAGVLSAMREEAAQILNPKPGEHLAGRGLAPVVPTVPSVSHAAGVVNNTFNISTPIDEMHLATEVARFSGVRR